MRKDTVKIAALIAVLCCAAGAMFVLSSGIAFTTTQHQAGSQAAPASSAATTAPSEAPAPEVPPVQDAVVRLRAVGDNLIHDSIYRQASE